MGWEVRSGVHIATAGPVPETGDINITNAVYVNGKPVPLPSEVHSSDDLAKWRGYSLDMHGQPAIDADHPRDPVWRSLAVDGPLSRPIELVRIRVRPDGCDLFAELIVLPIEGRPIRVSLFGWEAKTPRRMPLPAEIEKAVRGLELLGLVRDQAEAAAEAARGPGRPPDSGDYGDASEPRFFEDLGTAAHATVRDGDPLSYASLARHGLTGDRRTVKKYVEHFGYDLPKIETEAVECTRRLFTCRFHVRDRAKFKKNRA